MGLGTAAASATVGEMALGSALAGGATAGINSLLGGASSSKEYEYTRRLQKHDQAFQKEMRETAYQTMVGDMEKAGINPAVALSGGGGQTMGGSSSASAPNVNYGQVDLASVIGAINQTALTKAQKENIDADTNLKEKQSGKTEAETESTKIDNQYKEKLKELEIATQQITNKKTKAEIEKTFQEIHKMEKELRKMDEEIAILKAEGKIKEAQMKTITRNRRAYAILEMTESATRSIGNLIDAGSKAAAVGQKAINTFAM